MTLSRLRPLCGPLAAIALITAFYVLSYRDILAAAGHVYQNWDQTIPPFGSELKVYGGISRDAWTSIFELGAPAVFAGINRYFDLIMRLGGSFLGGPQLAKWYFLFYALVGGLGYWKLSRRLGLSFWPSMAVCLLSQFNPRTYTLAVSGHGFETSFSLMLVPWIVDLAEGARLSRGAGFVARSLGAGMAGALAFSGSPIGLALSGMFLAVWWTAATLASRSLKPLAVLAVAGAVILSAQAHWVLPAMKTGTDGAKYNQGLSDMRAHYGHLYRDFSSPPRLAMIGHTRNLGMGTEQAYPVEGDFGRWWEASAYALLGLALLGLIAGTRSRPVKAFGVLCLLAGFWFISGYTTIPGRILYEGVLGRAQMVFFLMARPMRWLPLYQTGLAILVGLGLQAVAARSVWRGHRWPETATAAVVMAALAVYLAPWWRGELTAPRNRTTQTMSLMPQSVPDEEKRLVDALGADPGLYRVTILPTTGSVTGDVPEPPESSLTRNFGLTGKDSLVGPAFMGQPFGRFLASMVHRPLPATDSFGRILGLGAVKRVFFDTGAAYLSYNDYGWMPRTRRGPETLADPGDTLGRFLEAQKDLTPDPAWTFGQFQGLNNKDYMPRGRVADSALLAAGGMPLLAALAELPQNVFARSAMFFGTDMDAKGLDRLGAARRGVAVAGEGWPELAMPWLPAGSWRAAAVSGSSLPPGWKPVGDDWTMNLWLAASPLDGAAVVSGGESVLSVPLSGAGQHRVFARIMSLPGRSGVSVSFKGRTLAEAALPDPLDRGWRWLDLGVLELDGNPLEFSAQGPGAIVSGALAAPVDVHEAAVRSFGAMFPPEAGSVIAVQAESCAAPGSVPVGGLQEVPLLGTYPGLSFTQDGLRLDAMDHAGGGTLAAEGGHVARAEFTLELPYAVSAFTLETSPRLFGDTEGLAFVRAWWSTDGRDWQPLYDVAGNADGKWEDVYVRKLASRVEADTRAIHIRFELRQAQLNSLDTPPNHPMRLLLEPRLPFTGVPSMGQAVLTPARFTLTLFRPGSYRVWARLLTRDGARWYAMGVRTTGTGGALDLSGGMPGAACDLFVLESADSSRPASEDQVAPSLSGRGPELPPVELERVNQARYDVVGALPEGGLLLFSENYHPRWEFSGQPPLKAYGFMNAYALPTPPPASGELLFTPQRLRDSGDKAAAAAWLLSGVLCLGCAGWAFFQSRRKQDNGPVQS